jgi:hypothetical protein
MKYRIALVTNEAITGVRVPEGLTRFRGQEGITTGLARALLWNDEQEANAYCDGINSNLGVMDKDYCYRVQEVPEGP